MGLPDESCGVSEMSTVDLRGKVAVVTGGAKGVGRMITEELVAAGASVVVVGRDANALADVATLSGDTTKVIAIGADVGDASSPSKVFDTTRASLGPVDILVNNAGVANLGPIDSIDPDLWWAAFELNVRAPMRWTQAVLPEMIKRGSGMIINVSSTAVVWAIPGGSAYSASKAALSKMTQVLDTEVRAQGLRVFAYAPLLDTEMARHIGSSPVMSDTFRRRSQANMLQNAQHYRQRSITLLRRILWGDLDHLAGQHLESETPPSDGESTGN